MTLLASKYEALLIRIQEALSQHAPSFGDIAGWSSPVARQAHNLEVIGSNPVPATITSKSHSTSYIVGWLSCLYQFSCLDTVGIPLFYSRIIHEEGKGHQPEIRLLAGVFILW